MRWLAFVFMLTTLASATRKTFPATHDSVRLENEAADSMGVSRILVKQQILVLAQQQKLVPLDGLWIAKKLPVERRYALPETVLYLRRLDDLFSARFGGHLVVTSAVRSADVQKKLRRRNHNAAPADGAAPSSHERGTTVDISRHFTHREYRWVVLRLLVDRALGRVLVIEEKACFHIFVGGTNETSQFYPEESDFLPR